MTESRNVLVASQLPVETAATLSFDERWARWQEKGARHDARVARNMRMIVALLLTVGVIWAAVVLP